MTMTASQGRYLDSLDAALLALTHSPKMSAHVDASGKLSERVTCRCCPA